jgi:outer membrane protein assembly factor BamD
MNVFLPGLRARHSSGGAGQGGAKPASIRRGCSLRLAAVALAATPISACSTFDAFNPFGGEKYETKLLPDVPAEDIYNQGLARIDKRNFKDAAKKFEDLEKQYPYSQWSRKGLLMTTYSQYEGGDYDSAIASANRYVQLYASSPDAPYALYMAAMSYYQQVPDISRDQENSEKALNLFNQITQQYPNSEYASDARYKIQVMRDQLAGKEMSIGRFYLTRRNYPAAINRFREVLAKYQTTRHTEEALERLTEAYMGLGITNEAQTAAAVLGHNYPDGQWYKDAYTLLQTNGLEPRESQESWISKAFHQIVPS